MASRRELEIQYVLLHRSHKMLLCGTLFEPPIYWMSNEEFTSILPPANIVTCTFEMHQVMWLTLLLIKGILTENEKVDDDEESLRLPDDTCSAYEQWKWRVNLLLKDLDVVDDDEESLRLPDDTCSAYEQWKWRVNLLLQDLDVNGTQALPRAPSTLVISSGPSFKVSSGSSKTPSDIRYFCSESYKKARQKAGSVLPKDFEYCVDQLFGESANVPSSNPCYWFSKNYLPEDFEYCIHRLFDEAENISVSEEGSFIVSEG